MKRISKQRMTQTRLFLNYIRPDTSICSKTDIFAFARYSKLFVAAKLQYVNGSSHGLHLSKARTVAVCMRNRHAIVKVRFKRFSVFVRRNFPRKLENRKTLLDQDIRQFLLQFPLCRSFTIECVYNLLAKFCLMEEARGEIVNTRIIRVSVMY